MFGHGYVHTVDNPNALDNTQEKCVLVPPADFSILPFSPKFTDEPAPDSAASNFSLDIMPSRSDHNVT